MINLYLKYILGNLDHLLQTKTEGKNLKNYEIKDMIRMFSA